MKISPNADNPGATPERCVIVLDQALPSGKAANAAAVLALTLGQRHPELVGPPFADASDYEHPGLTCIGITVLCASADDLRLMRGRALSLDCDVVDFPSQGQRTNDYSVFQESIRESDPDSIEYLGLALAGRKKDVRKLTGSLALLK